MPDGNIREPGSRDPYPQESVICRFGDSDSLVPGVFISSEEVECMSPPLQIQGDIEDESTSQKKTAFVVLEVSFMEVQTSPAPVFNSGTVWLRQCLSYPRRGPASGGTKVLVRGENLSVHHS